MNEKEMRERLRQIGIEAKNADGEALNRLLSEAEEIRAKLDEVKNRAKIAKLAEAQADNVQNGESGADPENDAAKRGKILASGGTVKKKMSMVRRAEKITNAVSSSSIPARTHTASDVKDTFGEVSTLADMVKIIPLPGGESYKRGYVKGYGEGDYTAESSDYHEDEPEFGYVEMTKTKITCYCEEPEEISKLGNSAYSDIIENSVETAIKKKLSRQILVGTGGVGRLCGIFCNPTDAADRIIDPDTDIGIDKITNTTLDEIVFGYGGNEEVEGTASLVLNKHDLKAFSQLTKSNGDKLHTIVRNGNRGTIDGIPYILNSACGAVSGEDTADGTYCMAYGDLHNYELPVFSDLDIQRSSHYKFKQGQIAHRGDIFAGGNVAAYNGFIRVKKAAVNTAADET